MKTIGKVSFVSALMLAAIIGCGGNKKEETKKTENQTNATPAANNANAASTDTREPAVAPAPAPAPSTAPAPAATPKKAVDLSTVSMATLAKILPGNYHSPVTKLSNTHIASLLEKTLINFESSPADLKKALKDIVLKAYFIKTDPKNYNTRSNEFVKNGSKNVEELKKIFEKAYVKGHMDIILGKHFQNSLEVKARYRVIFAENETSVTDNTMHDFRLDYTLHDTRYDELKRKNTEDHIVLGWPKISRQYQRFGKYIGMKESPITTKTTPKLVDGLEVYLNDTINSVARVKLRNVEFTKK